MTDTIIQTTVEQEQTPFELYMNGPQDFLIPIVFPDYLITVDESEYSIFGIDISTPKLKVPYLGHAGLLLINGKTGLTKYFEYGRYYHTSPSGYVRNLVMPDVKIVAGMISEKSLKHLLRSVSEQAGHKGRISGVVLRGDFYKEAMEWLNNAVKNNDNSEREEYDLLSHNCMTFVIDLADSLGLDTSWRAPAVIPTEYIEQFQITNVDIDYDYDKNIMEVSE